MINSVLVDGRKKEVFFFLYTSKASLAGALEIRLTRWINREKHTEVY